MTTWTLTLPWQRPPISANQRLHWAARARLTKDVRTTVALLAREVVRPIGSKRTITPPVEPPVVVELLWTVTDRRPRDTDSPMLTTKAAIDGLRDAGVLPGDHSTVVARSWCRITMGPAAGLALVVTEWREGAA